MYIIIENFVKLILEGLFPIECHWIEYITYIEDIILIDFSGVKI